MVHLTQASHELFRRSPDEWFESLDDLQDFCQSQREESRERWISPDGLFPCSVDGDRLALQNGQNGDGELFRMNDWSFGQLCSLARVPKVTANRLSAETASRVFRETLPRHNKPFQVLTQGELVRSLHTASYTRLFNAELLDVVRAEAGGFSPPPKGYNGATGLYAGQQDLFAFLIDPEGWIEIRGESFAPGFFVFNSEVGKRAVGVTTFWYQRICGNHIVWDVADVSVVSRRHTTSVREVLDEIRDAIRGLAVRRDQRKDAFVDLVARAMDTRLGADAEEVGKVLAERGFGSRLIRDAISHAGARADYSVFAVVDALTQLARQERNAGARNEADQKAAALLRLAA